MHKELNEVTMFGLRCATGSFRVNQHQWIDKVVSNVIMCAFIGEYNYDQAERSFVNIVTGTVRDRRKVSHADLQPRTNAFYASASCPRPHVESRPS